MVRMIRTFLPTRSTAVLCTLLLSTPLLTLRAQIQPDAVAIMGEIGPSFYLGEFNSIDEPNFTLFNGYDASVALKYNLASNFTLLGLFGTHGLSYTISNSARAKYAFSFFGPLSDTTYTGTNTRITRTNHIRTTKYLVMGQSNFNPTSRFVPYFTLGIGYLSFTVTNDDGVQLPKNMTGRYTNGSIIMPIGLGGQYFITDRLSVHAQALFYINSTDYLDGYAHFNDFDAGSFVPGTPGNSATPSDYIGSVTFGASFNIYQPERAFEPPPLAEEEKPRPEPSRPSGERPNPEQPTPPSSPGAQPPPSTQPNPAAAESMPSDADGDGLSDRDETDRYMTDPNNPDTDGDNLTDAEEVQQYNTSPNNPDTDHDGLSDGAEALVYNTDPLDSDTDDDQLSDGDEVNRHRTDPLVADTDSDQLSDGTEVNESMTDPLNPDTDGDGVIDGLDRCPTVAGPASNDGCPEGAAPLASTAPTTTPLQGVPAFVDVNTRADFDGILFQKNSDNFDFSKPQTAQNLWRLLQYMDQCDGMGVVIEGHSSTEGNPHWNQILSERRAKRVRDWLLANGVDPDKILGTIGYGGRLPRVTEPTPGTVSAAELEHARELNRRISALVRRPCK